MATFGQWKAARKPAVSSFGQWKASQKPVAAAPEKDPVRAVAGALKARQQDTIGAAYEAAGSILDTDQYDAVTNDQDAAARDAMARRIAERELAAKKGVTVNRGNQRYFDDAGVTDNALDTRAAQLRAIIEGGRKPGENRNVIPNAKEELALLREQRSRIAAGRKPADAVYNTVRLADELGLHSLGQAYHAEAQKELQAAEPYAAERGEGYIPNAGYIAEKAAAAVPDVVASIGGTLLGGPALGAALASAPVGLTGFANRKWEGAGNAVALGGAAADASAEYIGEFLGGKALGGLNFTNPAARVATAVGGQALDEAITEGLNIGTEIVLDGKTVTVDQGIKRLIDSGLIGAVSGGPLAAGSAFYTKAPEEAAKPKTQVVEPQNTSPESANITEQANPSEFTPTKEELDDAESLSETGIERLKQIDPTSAYDVAQTTTIEPVKIKQAEEIQLPEWVDQINAVPEYNPPGPRPYTDDPRLSNEENRVAREDWQSGGVAAPVIDQRKELARIREEALLAGRAGQQVLRDNNQYTPENHIKNWSAFNRADAKLKEFDKSNSKIEYSKASPTQLEALTELGNREEAFSTPKPTGTTTEEIARSVYPDFKPFKLPPQEGVQATVIEIPDTDKVAYIYESPDQVWLDVSELKQGAGGEAIYRIASARAQVAGKSFIPDPRGMSDIAKARRPELMLSEGVKHGNFDFLEPGDQVPGYSGSAGQKASALAEQNVKTVVAAYPEIADIVTDGEKFVNAKTGEVITDEQFDTISTKDAARNVPRGYRAGRRTLKRAAFLNTFSPERRETFGATALARLRSQPNNALPEPLRRLLYSKAGTPVSGATRTRVASTVDGAFGQGAFERILKSGRVQLHNSPADLPGTPDNVQGAYESKRDGGGDVIHLFASNLDQANVAGVLLHEYAHRGFEQAVGGAKEAEAIYSRLRELANTDSDVVAAYERAKNEPDVDREALAYFLENAQNKGVPESLFQAIARGVRKGLRAVGIKLKESEASDFKKQILSIARRSLKYQVRVDSKVKKAEDHAKKREEAVSELKTEEQSVDFSEFKNKSRPAVNALVEGLTNNYLIFDQLNQYIESLGGKVLDKTNVAMRLNTFSDKVAGGLLKIESRQEAFVRAVKESDVSLRDVGLWAALQYKDAYDKKTGVKDGSGIPSDFAEAERKRLEPKAKELQKLADMLTDIHQEALSVRFKGGLITKQEFDERMAVPNYVALRGYDNFDLHGRPEAAVPGMYGKSVSGKEYLEEKQRGGLPKFEDIAAHAFSDLIQSHMRAEWNKVVTTMMSFAVAHPDSGIFRFQRPDTELVKNPITGKMEQAAKKSSLASSNIYGKIKGKLYLLEVIDPRAAKALIESRAPIGVLERIVALPMNLVNSAAVKSATFTATQKVRDLQEAGTYLTVNYGAKTAALMTKNEPKALAALFRLINGKSDMSNPTDKALDTWIKKGGITQVFAASTPDLVTQKLRAQLAPLGFVEGVKGVARATKSGLTPGDYTGEFIGSLKDMGDAIKAVPVIRAIPMAAQLIEHVQMIGENSTRFAAYLALRETNPELSEERATYITKEAVTNFSRRGRWANKLAIIIPFYKAIAASGKSGADLVRSVAKNKKAMAGFAVAAGIAVAIGMHNAGYEDDQGNLAINSVNPDVRAKNIIVMYGSEPGQYIKFPVPQGVTSIINNFAQSAPLMMKLAQSKDTDEIKRLSRDLSVSTLNTLGPSIDDSGALDLGPLSKALQVNANKTTYGSPIYPEQRDGNDIPLAELTYGQASKPSQWIANSLGFIGSAGGGKPWKPFDWSPDQIDFIAKDFIPGIVKEAASGIKFGASYYDRREAAGSEYAAYKALNDMRTLPVIKMMLGNPNDAVNRDRRVSEDNSTKISAEKRRIRKINEEQGLDAADIERQNSPLLSGSSMNRGGRFKSEGDDLAGNTKRAQRDNTALNKIMKRWYNASELTDELIDMAAEEIDISDITTTKFGPYKAVVIERLKDKMNKIRHESIKE